MVITYDNSFNKNEIMVIVSLLIGLIMVWKLKKIFPLKEGLVYFLFGVFFGILFDHTISIPPLDYYDVNDKSSFQLIDFLTYIMYGPYSYAFIYFFKRCKVKISYTPLYILLWTLISISMEFVSDLAGVFHYKAGYNICYSVPIYLLVFTIQIWLHKFLTNKKEHQNK
jgi:hypothetical protein